MKSRKFYFMVVAIVFIITGCGSKAEPVSNEPTETIEGKEEIKMQSRGDLKYFPLLFYPFRGLGYFIHSISCRSSEYL